MPDGVDLQIAPGQLDLLAFVNSGMYPQHDVLVNGRYRGDGVAIGYAPGVSPPSWLTITTGQHDERSKVFDVPVRVNAFSLPLGEYRTSVRFATGLASGTVTGVVDLPVRLRVVNAPPVYGGQVALAGTVGRLSGMGTAVPLDFGGYVPQDVQVQLTSEMGDPTQWLAVDNNWRQGQLVVRVRPDLPVGTYAGSINVAYLIQGGKGLRNIPFRLDVTADAPIIYRSAPSYMHAGQRSELVLRGYAFDKAGNVEVSVGGVPASSVSVVGSTEIRAVFNAAPSAGLHTAVVSIDGRNATLGPIEVTPQPTYTLQDIVPPCQYDSGHVIFDPRRGNLIGFCDQMFYVLAQRDEAWQVVSQRKLTGEEAEWMRSKAVLTADQRYLIVPGKAQLMLLDPVTLQTVEQRAIPKIWFDSAGYGYLTLEAALNSGKIVFTISGLETTYYIYDLNNRTMTRTGQPTRYANVVNRDASGAALSTLRLVYVKNANLSEAASTDESVFSVTLLAAPDDWHADYLLPPVSPDGGKVLRQQYSGHDTRFHLYDATSFQPLGTIVSMEDYAALRLRFSPRGDRLYAVDGGEGVLEVFGTTADDMGLKHTTRFAPYSYYAALTAFLLTPDQGAAILYGATNGNGFGATPPIKVVPLPR